MNRQIHSIHAPIEKLAALLEEGVQVISTTVTLRTKALNEVIALAKAKAYRVKVLRDIGPADADGSLPARATYYFFLPDGGVK